MTYVAFEGVEGSGKSTIIGRIADLMAASGREVVTVREPGGTPVGEAVRSIVLGEEDMADWTEALLFAAQRAELAEHVIRPALERGAVVLGDRSVYSSLAYQGIARGLGLDAVRAVNEAGLRGTWPDLVIWLDVDAQRGLDRQEHPDRIGGIGLLFQKSVGAAYAQLAEAEPARVVRVDADDRPEAIVAAIMDLL